MRTAPRSPRRVAFILFGLLVAGSAAWFLLRPSPAPPPVVLHPTAAQVTETRQHLASLDQTVSRPAPGPRTLRLSEDDLNVTLAANKSVRKLLTSRGVQAVQIVLEEPNVVTLHASVRVQGHAQNIQIRGTLLPDPKFGVRFAASSAQAGRLPLPPALITAQANQLAARLSQPILSRLSLTIQSVAVEKKNLVLVGIAKASPRSASPARH